MLRSCNKVAIQPKSKIDKMETKDIIYHIALAVVAIGSIAFGIIKLIEYGAI